MCLTKQKKVRGELKIPFFLFFSVKYIRRPAVKKRHLASDDKKTFV